MHGWAIVRGCLLACTSGAFCALLLIVGAASALSPGPPDWWTVVPTVLGVAFVVALPLTGAALLGARYAAKRRLVVRWWSSAVGGAALGAMAGALIGPGAIVLLFGALGAATGLGAWTGAFGYRGRVRFGEP
jgi:hypothetical protein